MFRIILEYEIFMVVLLIKTETIKIGVTELKTTVEAGNAQGH